MPKFKLANKKLIWRSLIIIKNLCFHDCNFNLTIFLSKYEYLLREKIIENCINNSTNDKLYTDIMMMLRIFNSKNIKNRITIDDKFPKKKIIEIIFQTQREYEF